MFSIHCECQQYIPSQIGVQETSEIHFISEEIGRWRYHVSGIGVPPEKFATKVIAGVLNEEYTSIVTVKNPFQTTIKIVVSMDAKKGSEGAFALITNKRVYHIAPLAMLEIPYRFCPSNISTYHCMINVTVDSHRIKWRYPLKVRPPRPPISTNLTYFL